MQPRTDNTSGTAHRVRAHARGQRGFTLLEVMTVVLIIGVLAALALPSVVDRLRDRRTADLAERVSTTYRNGRTRAMGRGSSVLVRFTAAGSGRVQVREAVLGTTNVACADMPAVGCTRNWNNDALSRELSDLNVTIRKEYETNRITLTDQAGAAQTSFDICFSPLGTAWARVGTAGPLVRLTGTPELLVSRFDGTTRVGLSRPVAVLPNGTARLGTSR